MNSHFYWWRRMKCIVFFTLILQLAFCWVTVLLRYSQIFSVCMELMDSSDVTHKTCVHFNGISICPRARWCSSSEGFPRPRRKERKVSLFQVQSLTHRTYRLPLPLGPAATSQWSLPGDQRRNPLLFLRKALFDAILEANAAGAILMQIRAKK